MSEDRCCVCGAEATRLCDFHLGKRFPLIRHIGDTEFCITCDAPLCDAHAVNAGFTFYDGDAAHTCVDTIDRCPFHAGHKHDGFGPQLSEATTEELRRQARRASRKMAPPLSERPSDAGGLKLFPV